MFKKLLDLLKDSATYGASKLIAQVIGLLLLPVYTRYLSPADYGIAAMLGIFTALFAPIANLGMSNAVFRRFSTSQNEDERAEVLSTGLLSVIIATIVLALIVFAALKPLTILILGSDSYTVFLALAVVTAAINTIDEFPKVVLRAERRVKTAATLNTLDVITSISFSIVFIVYLQIGVLGFVLAGLAAAIVSTTVDFVVTRRSFRRAFNKEVWREMISYGLPFLPHRLQAFGMVYFSQYVLAHWLGLAEVGIYNIAMRIAVPATFVVGALQQSWVPYKFHIFKTDKAPSEFFRSVVTYYVAAVSYLWIIISLIGPEIIRLMTTEQFHSAARIVPIVALIPIAQGLYFMMGTGFELGSSTKTLPLVSFAGLAVVVTISFLAIRGLEAAGAAAATVAGWSVMAIVIYVLSQRRVKISYDWVSLIALGVLSSGFVGVGIFSQQFEVSPRLMISGLLCVGYPFVVLHVFHSSPIERERVGIVLARLRNKVALTF